MKAIAFAAALLVAAFACAVCASQAWADDPDDICGYAYLEQNADDSAMYTLVIQKNRREEGSGYRELGPVGANTELLDEVSTVSRWKSEKDRIREVRVEGGVNPVSVRGC